MKLRYKIIGEAPLPITDYDSTIQVLATGAGKSTVVWRSHFVPKPGAKDNVVIEAVTQLYLADCRISSSRSRALARRGHGFWCG